MSNRIQTVTGPISPDDLGTTLVHEHLLIGWPGWESDTIRPGPGRSETVSICVDRVAEMKDVGVTAMIDPCPNDLGRDVELMADVASKTGFQIICATGLYKEDLGGAPYWKFRQSSGGTANEIAELYIRELTDGIGSTGVKAGIIKVATGAPKITDYELMLLEAAAIAAKETGAPIITHTDEGVLGDEQQAVLSKHGVPPHRMIIGHSCGSSDHDYHMRIIDGGSYIAFDRFGIALFQSDEQRVASLLKLLKKGAASQVVVSHDSVWCWRGQPFPNPEAMAPLLEVWNPSHFHKRVIPMLEEGGATAEQIRTMLVDNPRRFFAGDPLPALG